jgi:hypothetical protein
MARRCVVLVTGWVGEFPRIEGCDLRWVPSGQVFAALRGAPPRSVVVLGENALREVRPEALRVPLRSSGRFAVGVYRASVEEEALRWAASGVAEVLPARRLAPRVEALTRIARRIEVPRAAWAPCEPGPGTLGESILEAIPRLEKPSAGGLVEILGIERHTLLRACRKAFGITVQRLCRQYLEAVVREERARGVRWKAMARDTGYANEQNLRRAMGNRRPEAPRGRDIPTADRDSPRVPE